MGIAGKIAETILWWRQNKMLLVCVTWWIVFLFSQRLRWWCTAHHELIKGTNIWEISDTVFGANECKLCRYVAVWVSYHSSARAERNCLTRDLTFIGVGWWAWEFPDHKRLFSIANGKSVKEGEPNETTDYRIANWTGYFRYLVTEICVPIYPNCFGQLSEIDLFTECQSRIHKSRFK